MKKTLAECLKEIRENAPPTERIVIDDYPVIQSERPLITDSFNPTPARLNSRRDAFMAIQP